LLLSVILVLCACGADPLLDRSSWTDRLTVRQGAAANARAANRPASRLQAPPANIVQRGTDVLIGTHLPDLPSNIEEDEERGTLNLVKVPLAEAAKTILGDILGLNYSVDDRVSAEITLQTTEPITKAELAANFQAILRMHGAAIVEQSGFYRIIPASEVARAGPGFRTRDEPPSRPGVRREVMMLRYVSAEAMRQILEPIAAEGSIQSADTARNALIVNGTEGELQNIRDTIAVFDIDWMKGMSFALYPVKTTDPQAMTDELETIFANDHGPLKNVIRFVPNRRLKSILVITSRSRYLKEASLWITRLDRAAGRTEPKLHVYHVQNRPASELAPILQSVFASQIASATVSRSPVAPKLDPVIVEGEAAHEDPSMQRAETPAAVSLPVTESAGDPGGMRIVADDANNSLLIVCTPADYERIFEVLHEIDSQPNQVMLEATIAEVTLNDELNFGMRWFFGEKDNRGTFTDLVAGAVVSSFPGFSYIFQSNADIGFVLNALSSLTKVRVLSSPTLLVLDNRTATLQVGDQVPVLTQTANSVTSPDSPVVSSVELKDTGVILNVTPRVNDSGRVTLEIKQEVSDVVETTTSGIDSPTIRQRKVATTVAVNDGDTLALGGLIQERNSTEKTKVPLLSDIPVLGTAFRSKGNSAHRTELVIFIRPLVTRNLAEARRITREFRDQMTIGKLGSPKLGTQMERDLRNIVD
jgi:general secretion pathway protein D